MSVRTVIIASSAVERVELRKVTAKGNNRFHRSKNRLNE